MAQRVRLDAIAGNIAGMNKVGNAADPPYRRRFALLGDGRSAGRPDLPGVHVKQIKLDDSPFRRSYEPGHPMADQTGHVLHPNVDLAVEMVNAMEASRAYEANVTAMEVTKSMFNATLRLIA